jgi:hypothetical protein
MTRSLLERAAKAAGYEVTGPAYRVVCQGVSYHALIIKNERGGESVWDPIDYDSDALRLAVKLGLTVYAPEKTVTGVWVCVVQGFGPEAIEVWEEVRDSDPYAATRLAIVRAAASLAKD